MEDVKRAIDSVITNDETTPDFLELAQRWATHSLANYKDDLLTKALAVSKALAEFDYELNLPRLEVDHESNNR